MDRSERIEQPVIIALTHFPGSVGSAGAGSGCGLDDNGPIPNVQFHYIVQTGLHNEWLWQPYAT